MVKNCPKCNSENIAPVRWTWWGGAVGPAIIKTSKCSDCGAQFNTNTGGSNSTAIGIYIGVSIAIALVLTVVVMMAMS